MTNSTLLIYGYVNGGDVYVNDERLEIEPSQKIRNHSQGFSWGYLGSGCSQLALAILLKYTNRDFAVANYIQFKEEYVATWNVKEDVSVMIDLAAFVQKQQANPNC